MENGAEKIKRKCKIAYIGTNYLKWMLEGVRPDENENISFPALEGLPEGFVIMHMFLSMRRAAMSKEIDIESLKLFVKYGCRVSSPRRPFR